MFPVEPVVLPPCFLLHGTHGCNRHPAFPAPSTFSKGKVDANLGRIAPRECGRASLSSARGARCLGVFPLPLAGEGAKRSEAGGGALRRFHFGEKPPPPPSPPTGEGGP